LVFDSFLYPPSPQILQWIAAGQLANRLQRSVRMWVILNQIYDPELNWTIALPETFTYPDLRDRIFASTHPKSDRANAQYLKTKCSDRTTNPKSDRPCICNSTLSDLIFTPATNQLQPEWQQQIMHITGLSVAEIKQQLQQHPFAIVHRSIREDLKQLSKMGWLEQLSSGKYRRHPPSALPSPPIQPSKDLPQQLSTAHLSQAQTWELMRVLESISFVQPSLNVVVRSLWEQLTDITPASPEKEPEQRIFIHFDYIISEEMQDRVDTYQEQIEQLWHKSLAGVIQFEYWLAENQKVPITVYPVCLHYLRRAKYLSAYGIDPSNNIAWHNYRLDRIACDRLTVLTWGDPRVPKPLKDLWHTGQLPTPNDIQSELETAWGFNFYLKSDLLIIRFPPAFARWYVDNTIRHHTFKPIAYKHLPSLINKEISNPQQRHELLQIVNKCKPSDRYYRARIRADDINVLMRLREWRPNGEVIAPLSIRQRLMQEAADELTNYQN